MKFKNILFIDIETVATVESYDLLSDNIKSLWNKKAFYMNPKEEKSYKDLYKEKAGIFSEFGKIIVIAVGFLVEIQNEIFGIRVSCLYDKNEKILLQKFKFLLENKFSNNIRLCAHNGKEFDFPYICRRMLINNISLPPILQLSNKKPWEIQHLDTMEMWKFGDKKNFTSLDLLANIFDIKSSKNEIDGSKVQEYFYEKKDLNSIKNYCMDDVIVLIQVFLKLNNFDIVKESHIEKVENPKLYLNESEFIN